MFLRLIRALKALLMGSFIATAPVKTITVIVLSILFPYLIYAFFGGALFILILIGTGFLLWFLANRSARNTI